MIAQWLLLLCAAVPGVPSGVLLNASTPNTLRLVVQPPIELHDDDGLDVLGYRVQYDNGRVYDFHAGTYY